MDTGNFDSLSEHKPTNCELRSDYVYYSKRNFSWGALLLFILALSLGLGASTVLITVLVSTWMSANYDFQTMSIVIFVPVIIAVLSFILLAKTTCKEIGWLDEKGFHHEFLYLGFIRWKNNISRCSIRRFRVAEIEIPEDYISPGRDRFCVEIVTTGKTFQVYRTKEKNPRSLTWIVAASNTVLQNLAFSTSSDRCEDKQGDSQPDNELNRELEKDDYISVNSLAENETTVATSSDEFVPLPPIEEFTLNNIPTRDKPGCSDWNMEQNLDNCQFSRRNKFSWEDISFRQFILLSCSFVFIFATIFFIYVGWKSNTLLTGQTLRIKGIEIDEGYSFVLYKGFGVAVFVGICIYAFSFLFTRFTTVAWTFTSQKATINRTFLGITCYNRTFYTIGVTHFRIQLRTMKLTHLKGDQNISDYFHDVLFLDGNDNEVFRIKKVEHEDAKWILCNIQSYFRR